MDRNNNIVNSLEKSFEKYSECNAVYVNNTLFTYNELYDQSTKIKNAILKYNDPLQKYIGILCYKTINAYSGIVGTLISGHAYLPLNPYQPSDRLKKIVEISDCNTIVLSEECADTFKEILDIGKKLIVICPDPGEKIRSFLEVKNNHKFIFSADIPDSTDTNSIITPEDPAYLIFTSGSTGMPKGVPVSHKNLFSFSNYTQKKYQFNNNDRISQAPDISFDLSIQDIFPALISGSCLYVVPKKTMISPAKFIKEHNLTVWCSVPSVMIFMSKMKLLTHNIFPQLRYIIFCGEALPYETAEELSSAAPNSIIDNLYGPTEATCAFTGYRWNNDNSKDMCINGLVPIGKPFEGQSIRIINNNVDVSQNESGELYLSGDQVVKGYYKDEKQTNEKFVTLNDDNKKWYRTGDIVKIIEGKNLAFIGRIDEQIKVRGYSVELLEINNVLREAVGHQMAVTVPQFINDNSNVAESIIGYIEGDAKLQSKEKIINYCKSSLPEYMVPSDINFIPSMPLNINGKIDKTTLSEMLNSNNTENVESESRFQSSDKPKDIICNTCLKLLSEDAFLRGPGFIKILNHQGQDDYICHICFKGF